MPRRSSLAASSIGAVTRLCPGPCGGSRIQNSMLACAPCWKTLPRRLQNDWLTARDGDCDSGPALDTAGQAIRDYLRSAR